MENYKQAMTRVTMSEQCKKEILYKIHGNYKKRKAIYFKRAIIFMLAVITVTATTATIFGQQIINVFNGWLIHDEKVGSNVYKGEYSASDEHVKMEIVEILSDVMTTKMVIKYTSLDKQGKIWINENMSKDPYANLHIIPGIKGGNSFKYGVNYTCSCRELTDFSMADERYYEVTYLSSGNAFGTQTAYLYYSLPSKMSLDEYSDYVEIKLTDFIEMKEYDIDSNLDNGKLYTPSKLRISPLGICIYGSTENCHITYKYLNTYTSLALKGDNIDSLSLILNDGSKINLLEQNSLTENGWSCISKNQEWSPEYEKRWQKLYDSMQNSDNFTIISDGTDGNDLIYSLSFAYTMAMEDIAGIEIDGTEYYLSPFNSLQTSTPPLSSRHLSFPTKS